MGKKILVADDSLTIQKVIRLALSNEGYEIQAVSDGNEATQQISLMRPDLVLIDVSLPGKSAFEVKRMINDQPDARNVKFILMSSAFEKVDETQADQVKFHGRLTKPFDPASLRETISEVLASATMSAPQSLSPSPILDELWDNSIPPPLPPISSPESPPSEDSDIRNLTESTIRMSGLDDFQWSVNEPSLKPPAGLMDAGGNTFPLDPPPPPSVTLPGIEPPPPPQLATAPSSAPSTDKVEEIVRKELQRLLPEVAERVIKQEIHRLLTEMQ